MTSTHKTIGDECSFGHDEVDICEACGGCSECGTCYCYEDIDEEDE